MASFDDPLQPDCDVLPVLSTCLVVALVGGLLYSEAREARRPALFWKAAASAGFVVTALLLGALDRGAFGAFILLGLVLSAAGDVALALPGQRAFLLGLVAFLLGHVAYIVACATIGRVGEWIAPPSLLPAVATGVVYSMLAPHLGSMRVPVVAYMATITVMVAGAIACERSGVAHGAELLAGALLFYVSDLSVARDRFVRRTFVNRAWGLPAYYAGQLFLAWAARAE